MVRPRGVLKAWLAMTWLAMASFLGADESVRVLRSAEIYARPSGDSAVVALARGGQLLEVITRQGDWYQVRIPSTTQVGHVPAPLVEPITIGEGAAVLARTVAPSSSVLPFSMGSPIPLGPIAEGPVLLQTARFRLEKGQLKAEIYATCDEGEDQEVTFTLELLDELDRPMVTLNGKGGVEEEDDSTLKARAHVPADTLALVRSFTLRANANPD